MPIFKIKVTENYSNEFEIKANSLEEAKELAEEMAVERDFPKHQIESCSRDIEAEEITQVQRPRQQY